MTIQLTTKKKKILTNYHNEATCKAFFSCNIYYEWYFVTQNIYFISVNCSYCFVWWTVCKLSVCRMVNRQHKHNISWTMHYHRCQYRQIIVCRHYTESFTGNAIITDEFADGLSMSAFHKELHYKCHNHRQLCGWIPSIVISQRVVERAQSLTTVQMDIVRRRQFIITDGRCKFQRAGY
jgi:hypothetical protein